MTVRFTECDVIKQKEQMERQETDDYWKEFPGAYFIAYAGEEYCTLIKTILASDAKQAARVSECPNFRIQTTLTMNINTNIQDRILDVRELESLFKLEVLRRDSVVAVLK